MRKTELSPDVTRTDTAEPAPPAGGTRRNRRRALGVFLGVLAAAFVVGLVLAWLRWGRFDPGTVGVQLTPTEQAWYSTLLLVTTATGAIALAATGLLAGSWLARRSPRAHRYITRIYLYAGVYPTVGLAVAVVALWPYSTVTTISQLPFFALWATVTTYAVVLGRQGRRDDQRRWMLRSFALTASILLERLVLEPLVGLLLGTQLDSRFGGNVDILMQLKDSTVDWLALTIVVVAVEWKFERERLRATNAGAGASNGGAGHAPATTRPR